MHFCERILNLSAIDKYSVSPLSDATDLSRNNISCDTPRKEFK